MSAEVSAGSSECAAWGTGAARVSGMRVLLRWLRKYAGHSAAEEFATPFGSTGCGAAALAVTKLLQNIPRRGKAADT